MFVILTGSCDLLASHQPNSGYWKFTFLLHQDERPLTDPMKVADS